MQNKIITWEMDPFSWRYVFVSSHAAGLLGYPIEEWYAERFWEDHIHPDDRLQTVEQFKSAIAGGEDHEIEYRMDSADGREVWVRDFIAVEMAGDQPKTLRGFLTDISPEKHTGQSKHDTGMLFEQAARIANVGHWEWDEVTDRLISCSEEMARIFGMSVDEYIETSSTLDEDLRWFHPDDRDRYVRERKEYIAANAHGHSKRFILDSEYRFIRRDGDTRNIRELAEPIFDETDRHVRSVGTIQDITDRKCLEIQLQESEERLRVIIDNSPAAILLKDKEGRYQVVNSKFCEWYGGTPETVIGKTFSDLTSREEADKIAGQDKEAIAKKTAVQWELTHVLANGETRTFLAHKFPIFGADGEVNAIGGIDVDITESKVAEQKIRQAHDELELRVHERTEQLRGEVEERKFIEVALRESEEHFHALFDESPLGITVEDYSTVKQVVDRLHSEGVSDIKKHLIDNSDVLYQAVASIKLIESNNTLGEVFGPGEIDTYLELNARKKQLDHEGWSQFYAAEISALAGSERTFGGEYSETLPDGRPIEVRCISRVLNGYEETWARVISTHENITERKHAEAALLESKQRIQDFAESSSDWFWEMGPDLKFSFLSTRFKGISGIELNKVLGKSREELAASDEDQDKWQGHLDDLKNHRPFRDFQYEIQHPDSGTIHVRTSGTPVLKYNGEFMGYRGTATDTTAQVLAEHRAATAEHQLADAIEGMNESVALYDSDERFILCNSKYREVLGEISDVLVPGTSFADVCRASFERGIVSGWDDVEKWIESRVARFRNGERPVVHQLRNGRWVMSGEHKTSNGSTLIIRTDVTELKETQLKLEEVSNFKSSFLSSMSHELRTPMNAILGFGQMLEFNPDEPLTKAQKTCVDHILKGGQHLLKLINDVLDLTKIEAGKVELSIEDIWIGIVVDDCQILLKEMAASRDIKIILPDADQTAGLVRADLTRLKQVMLNLMSNAVKYNHDGGAVTVDFKTTPDGMGRISVTDTGDGIPANKKAEIFKPFSRLGAESSGIEGTGIGLVVCKDLVELMGGEIGFESEYGKGTTFWFELPLPTDHATGEDVEHEIDAAQAKGTLQSISGTMLYVEDNPPNLQLMQMIVSRIEGLTMYSAHTAELGIEIARSKRPDVIVLDINLPGMGGITALNKLRGFNETKDIPVLALSSAATQRNIDKGMKAGFQAYLTKPMQVVEVTDAIRNALESSE